MGSGKSLNKAEMDKLLKQARADAAKVTSVLQQQKARQLAALAERRRLRRSKQTDDVKVGSKIKNERPHEALLEKHAAEFDALLVQIDRDSETGLVKAKQDVRRKREAARDKIEQRNSDKRTEKAEKALDAFEETTRVELEKFDEKTAELLEKAKLDPRISLEHASKKLALREKHLRELAQCVRRAGVKDDLLASAAQEAEQ